MKFLEMFKQKIWIDITFVIVYSTIATIFHFPWYCSLITILYGIIITQLKIKWYKKKYGKRDLQRAKDILDKYFKFK
jgi:hypothetical protein